VKAKGQQGQTVNSLRVHQRERILSLRLEQHF
jgi:hypothetical protein